MKSLENLAKKRGFTYTEITVIVFIIFFCIVGTAVNIIKNLKNDTSYLEFNYKEQDSLFNAAAGDFEINDTTSVKEEKKIASKSELLDFPNRKSENVKKGSSSISKLININTASISELTSIPGIGKTVAERIIEYRQTNGKFKNIGDLQNIKGIGKTKLSKISGRLTFD